MLKKENCLRIENRIAANSKYKTYVYECKEDECKNEIFVQECNLKNHSGLCNSCSQKKNSKPYKHLYTKILISTKRRLNNLDIDKIISYEDFIKLIENNNNCSYCGSLVVREKYEVRNGVNSYFLDRKDSNVGYIKSNLVTCCWDCNKLKSNLFSFDEFLLIGEVLKEIKKLRINNN